MSTIKHRNSGYTVAIDPGTHIAGVAIFQGYDFIESFSVKNPHKTKDADIRGYNIIGMIDERVRKLVTCSSCFKAHATLVFENPQYFKGKGGARPIEPVVRMVGMISFWAMSAGYNVYKHNVATIKTGIAGRSKASKEEVERIMVQTLNLEDLNRTDHEYDAMAVGVFHLDYQDKGCFGVALPAVM